jgi:hypothetical protein
MRTHVSVRLALLFLAIAAPALVRAQFQPPTDEELKMTSDPKAPGAAAVYLYREETTDDHMHFHSYYERIKVLTEKGKELATIHIPYEHGSFKVTDIKGRTIHADGTVIPLTASPSDLMDFKTKTRQVNEMVFTLPSVEVGSIFEYRLQIRYADDIVSSPSWEIQQTYFVHKAHYVFTPDKGGGHYITNSRDEILDRLAYTSTTATLIPKVVHEISGRYTLDLTDIPPLPNDDWMPPLNTIKWRLEFYYTHAASTANFWESEGKFWAKESERFANPSSSLKKAVSDIVSPGDSDEQKARKIYAVVMKLDNTRFSRTKSEAERKAEKLKTIKNAEDVWKQQSGTDDEITLLYIALARAAGLKVWPMKVVDRSRAIFDSSVLSASQLDDYIAIVEIGGKEVYLDPGQKMCPFGMLHWKHTMASGLRLTDKGPSLARTALATYKEAVVQRTAMFEIDEHGSVKGTARFVMAGPDALYWRQLALQNDEEEVKKQFNESMRNYLPDGVQGDFDHFLALDDYPVNLIAFIKISGSLGTATGKHFFLPGLFFQSNARHPFVAQDKRTVPIDLHYADTEQDNVTYNLPPGYSVETTPQAADVTWPGSALLKITSTAKDGSVTVVRTFAHNFALLPASDYNDLRNFYQKVATADQQQLVLTRATPAKGN